MLTVYNIVIKRCLSRQPSYFMISGVGTMERFDQNRRSNGTKAIAIDERARYARYRLYILLSLLSSAGLALALHVIFEH